MSNHKNDKKTIEWNLVEVELDKVKPNAKNPKIRSEVGMRRLRKSLAKFGIVYDGILNKDFGLIDGHSRLEISAERKTGRYFVPTRQLTHEEYVEMNAIFDAAKAGEPDLVLIEEVLTEETFEEYEFESKNTATMQDDNFAGKVPKLAISELGDIYTLNDHHIMCADATSSDSISKLLHGKRAEMVFTDPPYRMEAEGGSSQPIGRAAAKLGENIKHLCDFDPVAFLNVLPLVFEAKKMNAYIFCNKDLVPDYLSWARDNGYSFNILFWKKPNAIPLGEQHRPDVEYLLLFRKSATWNNGLKDVNYSKCLVYGRENSTAHPTMKPIELIGNEIKISSKPKGIVLDFFLGSGSTLIAAEQLGRSCYGFELAPAYLDITVARWIKYVRSQGTEVRSLARNGKPLSKKEQDSLLAQIE